MIYGDLNEGLQGKHFFQTNNGKLFSFITLCRKWRVMTIDNLINVLRTRSVCKNMKIKLNQLNEIIKNIKQQAFK